MYISIIETKLFYAKLHDFDILSNPNTKICDILKWDVKIAWQVYSENFHA